jgi:hypothetical protein
VAEIINNNEYSKLNLFNFNCTAAFILFYFILFCLTGKVLYMTGLMLSKKIKNKTTKKSVVVVQTREDPKINSVVL